MILKVPEDYCDVFDANGERLQYAVWCDTETGEAVHLVRPFESAIDDAGEAVVRTEWRQHPAPLKFSRFDTHYEPPFSDSGKQAAPGK